MASDDAGEAPVSTTVETSLQEWLDEQAEQLGVSRAELVRQLLAAYQSVLDEDEELDSGFLFPDGPDPEDLEAQLSTLEADVQRKIEDVRERVVQVKRETDGKAPTGHDHEDLREQAERAASGLAQVRAEVGSLQEVVGEVREDLDAGFENYEDILEYLADEAAALDEKLAVLASTVIDVRDRSATLAARESARRAADELAREANRRGIRTASCAECASRVDLGLLARPECPHCAATFSDVEEGGWFRPATLVVGDVPALEEAGVDPNAELDALVDEEGWE